MSLRKRSLTSLLVVLGLVVASIAVIILKPTVLGLDLQGGTEVILQAEATADGGVNQSSLKRAVNVINRRVNAIGVSEAEVQVVGGNKIRVALPGVEDQAQVDNLVKAAQLKIYSYEPNLIGRLPFPAPASTDNPTTDLYALITYANDNAVKTVPSTASGPYWYLFRKDDQHTFVSGPSTTKDGILTALKNDPNRLEDYQALTKTPAKFEYRAVPKGSIILTEAQSGESYDKATLCGVGGTCVLMKEDVAVNGGDVTSATAGLTQGGQPNVQIRTNDAGTKKFAAMTKALAVGARNEQRPATDPEGQFWHFAMAVDDVIISRPYISYIQNPDGIDSNQSEISGGFTESSAKTLADQISSGALPIKLTKVSTAKVGAAYGNESLHKGLTAGLIGLIIVIIGLIAYYRVLGVIAALIIIIYGLMLWAVAKIIPIALTLPGIAGTLLTIGVAADASVVIFERVREEIRQGRPPKTAVLSGYKRGITAIIDGNVVTLLTAVFIFLLSTSGPRGFAFTLMVGVLLALFTAVIATPAALGLLVESKLFKNEKLVGLVSKPPRWKMDVVGKWKFWLGISFVPLVIGLVFIFTNGVNQGIDFTGGSKQTITFAKTAPSELAVRDVVSAAGYGDAKVIKITQTIAGKPTTGFSVESRSLNSDTKARTLLDKLNAKFKITNGEASQLDFTAVGPTFGRDVVRNAIFAILFSFLAIIGYLSLRFEWKLALPALASVVHDVWLSLTVYSIAGLEVTAATVAAFLTILGYSLYDVVIVFDRIRENEPLMRGARYRDVVNRSVHETLTRSIITMVSTLLPVVVLFVFGGDTLRDFSFALLIGILAGGVSSIFISAPLAALWKEHEPDQQKLAARLARKQARAASVDSDIVDVEALRRAEAAMDAQVPRTPQTDIFGQPVEEPMTPPQPSAELPETTVEDSSAGADAPTGAAGTAPKKDRQRRHQNVQRKRRR